MQFALHAVELPTRIRTQFPLTDDELLQFSAANGPVRIERLATGELIVMSPTGGGTGRRNIRIAAQLLNWADESGAGVAFDSSTGFRLPDGSVLSPDASFVSRDRWNALTEAEQKGFAPITPEFVVELQSESDRLPELRVKMQDWLANGVELAWLIDPERKAVEIYRPGHEPEIQEGHTAVYGEGPVGGFILELTRIWS